MSPVRPYRLAILGTRGIPARYGGFETFAEELGVRLAALGHAVTVYCEAAPGDQPAEHRGVRLVYVPALRLGPLTTILFDLRCVLHAMRHNDVVYMLGHGASPFCWLPRLFGARVWINMDGIEWKRSKWNLVGRIYLRISEFFATLTANTLVADADGIRDYLVERFRWLPKVSVIPYGAHVLTAAPDPALLGKWGLIPGGYYLLVARMEPENHVLEAVEGFLASDASEPLIVVGGLGDTAYHARLRRHDGARVRFVGGVYDPPRLAALRYHCKACFHGHSVGGTNPSLLEALGAGNLVIAHDNPFNREVMAGAGWYFRAPADVPAAVAAVSALPADERRRVADAMRARVATAYSWESIVDRYLVLMAEEVGHGG